MRRLLPVFFCVVASTGLTACDDQPVSGPSTDEEQALYDVRAAPFPNGIPGFFDGDVELRRPAGGGGGGGDILVFDIVDAAAYDANGVQVQSLTDGGIASPGGEVLCTKTSSGGFVQLRDADGDVLFSSIGPFVFDGQPELAGKNPVQQFQALMSNLRFSYDHDAVVEGFASSGQDMVHASVPVQFSSSWRKLVIASLVDGYCGSDGIEVDFE